MKFVRKYLMFLAVSSAMLALAFACSKSSNILEENPQGGNEDQDLKSIPVSMAFNLKDAAYTPATKTLPSVAQTDAATDNSKFRGMSRISFLPFEVRERDIAMEDVRSHDYLTLPYSGIANTFGPDGSSGTYQGLISNNNSHFYKGIYVPANTSSFLVYGQAKDETSKNSVTYTAGTQQFKHLNGSLIPSDAGTKASDITFSPDPIADAALKTQAQAKAQQLADLLNTLFNKYTLSVYRKRNSWYDNNNNPYSYSFNWTANEGNDAIKTARSVFINDGGMIAASGTAVAAVLQNLYRSINDAGTTYVQISVDGNNYDIYSRRDNNNSYRYTYSRFYNATIGARIQDIANVSTTLDYVPSLKDADLRDFPTNLGLPEGCMAIKWDNAQQKFVPIFEGSPTIQLAPMEKFCYPPSLWYYSNSTIQVSNSESETEIPNLYKSTSATWTGNILSHYTDGTIVKKGVTSVAIVKPLQYAVALLELNLAKPTSSPLKDADNDNVTVNNSNMLSGESTNFPLTAVIVAGQHKQNFNFTPMTGNEYYVYDNMPFEDNGNTAAWISSGSGTNRSVYTLLLQTIKGEDVKIAIEFRNNTTKTFRGATGYIVPGSRFYMYGIIKREGNGAMDDITVFQQDYRTIVNVKINDFAKAYNCIPDLQDPQLEIGVEINVDWILGTPINVPLY